MSGPVVLYRGIQPSEGGAGVIQCVDKDDDVVGTVAHLVRHSPTGLGWGYLGSGPADCARSLLIAALGSAARCPSCREASAHGCPDCDEGYRTLPYHQFLHEVIGGLPDRFTFPRGHVVGWLLLRAPDTLAWLADDLGERLPELPQ